jgi:hypothetical protein
MIKKSFVYKGSVMILLVLAMGLVLVGTIFAKGPSQKTKARSQKSNASVFWSWDFENGISDNPVGSSKLVRTSKGIKGSYKTDALTPGNAATLWFIVFNNPKLCEAGEYMCSPKDLGDTPAQGDFFLAGGHVVGGKGKAKFAGQLKVGDKRRSGLAETIEGCEDCTPGLIDPEGALVVLAIHDHGPAQTGQTLKAQISSFLGGCVGDFNGNVNGFAEGPGDIPDADGECSTIQFSPHMPSP